MKQLLIVAGLMWTLSLTGGCASTMCGGGGCTSSSCDTNCSGNVCCNNCNGGCQSCSGGRAGICGTGCVDGQCGHGARGLMSSCRGGACTETGCRPGPLCWQQGGTDYAHKLTYGMVKHGQVEQTPGPPSASVAYPYYTTRGPRDFLNPNPPSIGY
ncbi:MAG: hypothetical protein R3C05_20860 [Pirellulaceae bacterium]